jgi:hypothetical protein
MEAHPDGSLILQTEEDKRLAARGARASGNPNLSARINEHGTSSDTGIEADSAFEVVSLPTSVARVVIDGFALMAEDRTVHAYTQSLVRGIHSRYHEAVDTSDI